MSHSNAKKYILGEIISKGVPFLLLPYFTHRFVVEEFGLLTLFQSYYNLFALFLMLGIDTVVIRYRYRYGKNGISIIDRIYTVWLLFLLLLSAVFLLFYHNIYTYSFLTATLFSYLNYYLSIEQASNKANKYIFKQILNSILATVITFAIVEIFKYGYESRVLSVVMSLILVILFCRPDIPNIKIFSKVRFLIIFLYMIKTGSLLVIHRLSFFLRVQLDRILVAKFYGVGELAVFGLASQISMIASLFIIGISRAYTPHIFSLSKQNKKIAAIKSLKHLQLSCYLIPFVLVTVFFIPSDVYSFVFGDEYGAISFYLAIMLTSQSLQLPYIIMSAIIQFEGKFKELSTSVFLISMAYIPACFYFTSSTFELLYLAWLSLVFSLIQSSYIFIYIYRPIVKQWLSDDQKYI